MGQGLDRKFAFPYLRVPQEKIEHRQKYVVAAVGNVVMTHVVGAGKVKSGRKPAVHVNPPVDFLAQNQIRRPAEEDAAKNPLQPEQNADEEGWDSIDHE